MQAKCVFLDEELKTVAKITSSSNEGPFVYTVYGNKNLYSLSGIEKTMAGAKQVVLNRISQHYIVYLVHTRHPRSKIEVMFVGTADNSRFHHRSKK